MSLNCWSCVYARIFHRSPNYPLSLMSTSNLNLAQCVHYQRKKLQLHHFTFVFAYLLNGASHYPSHMHPAAKRCTLSDIMGMMPIAKPTRTMVFIDQAQTSQALKIMNGKSVGKLPDEKLYTSILDVHGHKTFFYENLQLIKLMWARLNFFNEKLEPKGLICLFEIRQYDSRQ